MINLINTTFAHTLEGGEADSFAMHHGFGMMGNFGWSGMFFGWLFMVLFWIIVVLAIIALIKYVTEDRNNKNNTNKIIKNEESNNFGKTYVCAECEYEYKEKDWALKCQKWCAEHKSCNIEIIKHGIAPKN